MKNGGKTARTIQTHIENGEQQIAKKDFRDGKYWKTKQEKTTYDMAARKEEFSAKKENQQEKQTDYQEIGKN